MHIQFLKQNKKEILNWVEVTARAIHNLSATIQSPFRGCMDQGETQKRGLCNKGKCSSFHSSYFRKASRQDLCLLFGPSNYHQLKLCVCSFQDAAHHSCPRLLVTLPQVPSHQLKHWPLRSYKCYFSFNILILMSLEVINSTSFMSLGPCLFAHHLLLM